MTNLSDFCVLYKPTVRPVFKWIPVEEKMPKEGEEVFVYVHDTLYIAWIENGKWRTENFMFLEEDSPAAWAKIRLYF